MFDLMYAVCVYSWILIGGRELVWFVVFVKRVGVGVEAVGGGVLVVGE